MASQNSLENSNSLNLDDEIARITKLDDVGLILYARIKNIRIFSDGKRLKKNDKRKLIIDYVRNEYSHDNDDKGDILISTQNIISPVLDSEIARIMKLDDAGLALYARTKNINIFAHGRKLKKNDKLKLIIKYVRDEYSHDNHQIPDDKQEFDINVLLNACRNFELNEESMIWANRLHQITSDDENENATNPKHLVSKELLNVWCGYRCKITYYLNDYLKNPKNNLKEGINFREVPFNHPKVIEYKNFLIENGYSIKGFLKRTFVLVTTDALKNILSDAPNREPRMFYTDIVMNLTKKDDKFSSTDTMGKIAVSQEISPIEHIKPKTDDNVNNSSNNSFLLFTDVQNASRNADFIGVTLNNIGNVNTNNILLNLDDEEIELEVLLYACREYGFSDESMTWSRRIYQITSDDEEENATNLQHLVLKEFLNDWCGYKYSVRDFLNDYLRNPINGLEEDADFEQVTVDHHKVKEYGELLAADGTAPRNFSQRIFILATTNTIKKILFKAPNEGARNFYMDLEKVLRKLLKQRCQRLKAVAMQKDQEKIEMEERHKKELLRQQYKFQYKYKEEPEMISRWTPQRKSGYIYIVGTFNMINNRKLKGGRTCKSMETRLKGYNNTGTAQAEKYYVFYSRKTNDTIKSEEMIFRHFKLFRENASGTTMGDTRGKGPLTEVLDGVPLPLATEEFDKIMNMCDNLNHNYDKILHHLLKEVRENSDNNIREVEIYHLLKEITELSVTDRINLFNDVNPVGNVVESSCLRREYNNIRDYMGHFKYSLIDHFKLNILEKYSIDDFIGQEEKLIGVQTIANRFMLAHLFI